MSAIKYEYAAKRKMRERNKGYYRVLHWPIWIWVFFLAPGPVVFDLFARGPGTRTLLWLSLVMACTAVAGFFGQLPGVEAKPYILRFDEDKPNPMYRRICYTFAWGAVVTFATLNLIGQIGAVTTGQWFMKQIYDVAYFPLYGTIIALGALGILPRVRKSTRGEGTERRYFYGSVWSVTISQTILMILWKTLPRNPQTDVVKLVVYVVCLAILGYCARLGLLLRTRPILPGEDMVAD